VSAVTLHRNAQRVQDALREAGSKAVVVELADSTRTSAEAAAAVDVEVGQIAKSLVFLADGSPVVAVLSGVDRLDTEKLRAHLGAGRIDRASADQVREATGFPIGGVSPVAHGVPVLVDRALGGYDVVWAAAGTPNAVFATSFDELVVLSGGAAADVRVTTTP
jgi:prolyl-tRNA editing enzyme YbaK/EbsC (Cys-tRNA(Pro) deacylase)